MTRVGAGTFTGSTSTPSSFASSMNRAPRLPAEGTDGARLHAQRGQHAGDVDALAAGLPLLVLCGQAERLDP